MKRTISHLSKDIPIVPTFHCEIEYISNISLLCDLLEQLTDFGQIVTAKLHVGPQCGLFPSFLNILLG